MRPRRMGHCSYNVEWRRKTVRPSPPTRSHGRTQTPDRICVPCRRSFHKMTARRKTPASFTRQHYAGARVKPSVRTSHRSSNPLHPGENAHEYRGGLVESLWPTRFKSRGGGSKCGKPLMAAPISGFTRPYGRQFVENLAASPWLSFLYAQSGNQICSFHPFFRHPERGASKP